MNLQKVSYSPAFKAVSTVTVHPDLMEEAKRAELTQFAQQIGTGQDVIALYINPIDKPYKFDRAGKAIPCDSCNIELYAKLSGQKGKQTAHLLEEVSKGGITRAMIFDTAKGLLESLVKRA